MRHGLPKSERLLKPAEFREVYAVGRRFDGRLMTVFVKPSASDVHRVGITASKKMSTKAHERNRAKRLLRESFRLSKSEVAELSGKFDWVINARRGLLDVKVESPLSEFRSIVSRLKNSPPEKSRERA